MTTLRPEEDQSIWSKRRQGFQPCCEAGIREPTLSELYLVPASSDLGLPSITTFYPYSTVMEPLPVDPYSCYGYYYPYGCNLSVHVENSLLAVPFIAGPPNTMLAGHILPISRVPVFGGLPLP